METPSNKRAYSGKDVDMLTASSSIIEQAIKHKQTLISSRSIWADPFLSNLRTRIQNAFPQYLGIDSAKEMRQATILVLSLQKETLEKLSLFKVQVMEDFKSDKIERDEILTNLGITDFLKDAQKNDQEALIELLYRFKQAMTADLKTKLTSKGVAATLIDSIVAKADDLKAANITQETLKGSRTELSASTLKEFNEIYSQVISIAKIASKIFKDNEAIKNEFSYSKTVKKLNHHSGKPILPKPGDNIPKQ